MGQGLEGLRACAPMSARLLLALFLRPFSRAGMLGFALRVCTGAAAPIDWLMAGMEGSSAEGSKTGADRRAQTGTAATDRDPWNSAQSNIGTVLLQPHESTDALSSGTAPFCMQRALLTARAWVWTAEWLTHLPIAFAPTAIRRPPPRQRTDICQHELTSVPACQRARTAPPLPPRRPPLRPPLQILDTGPSSLSTVAGLHAESVLR